MRRPDGVDFLVHRGFREYERSKTVRLELAGLTAPAVDLPAGVSLTTLAERPDLIEGVHAVAVEAFADIPGGDDPDGGRRPRRVPGAGCGSAVDPARGFFIATDDATGRRASATPACCSSRRTGAASRGTT